MMRKLSPEDALVGKITRGFPMLRGAGLRLGAGDDAALWQPRNGQETILTSDWFLEGSHFLRDTHPPDSVGWKCLARAASDIAAMGGTPRCFLLSLALPSVCAGKWLDGFLGGLRTAAKLLGCSMAGGDTTRNEKILMNVTVVGEVEADRAVLRSGARAGDLLFVSGRLGEAELGLQQLRKSKGLVMPRNAALRKHLYPRPRIALGRWLAESRLASAMMDISDGLSTDLARMCSSSGVGAVVEERAIPVARGVSGSAASQLGLHGGDDYELLFAVRPGRVAELKRSFGGVGISWVGAIAKGRKVLVVRKDGKTEELVPGGWDPFRGGTDKRKDNAETLRRRGRRR
jgi:thiamine-monophosphate kinase